ncbi:hypothetical protein [Actinopolymorpha alba]|uniref:hypothetical protein n=1 Tax=Actinopolymorpha alba TaxID=533267 RepID=UPI00036265C4|nr:hypothetical protein [Actinopolymorpha alba]
MIALLVGLFAFVAGGIASYAVASDATPTIGPMPCEDSARPCVPRLEAAIVIGALKAQGHTCTESSGRWSCLLAIGVTQYTFSLEETGGQIHKYSARVSNADLGPSSDTSTSQSKAAMSYLSWSAQLTYSHDPEFSAEIREWLSKQAGSQGKTVADVGGYEYTVDATDELIIDLNVEPVVPE